MQSLEETRSTQTAEALDEDGDVIGLAIFGGQRQEISGEYLTKSHADIGNLAAMLTLTGLPDLSPSGSIYVIELGTRVSNTSFKTGSFRAISIAGITG